MRRLNLFIDGKQVDFKVSNKDGKILCTYPITDGNLKKLEVVYDENIFGNVKFERDIATKRISKYKIEADISEVRDEVSFTVDSNYRHFVTSVFDYLNRFIDTETLKRQIELFKDSNAGKRYREDISKLLEKIESPSLEDMIMDSQNEQKRIEELLLESTLYAQFESMMSPYDLVRMITFQLFCSRVPIVDQNLFDEMVSTEILKGDYSFECLWRLAISYDERGYDYSAIESYYIDMRNAYYLSEYISSVDQADRNKIVDLVLKTEDVEFIGSLCEDNFIQAHLERDLIDRLEDYLKKSLSKDNKD